MLRSMAIGRLTADPVLKEVQIGGESVSVCDFSIAVNYGPRDNEQTEFIDCVAWRKLGEIIAQYGAKGRKVYVAGRQKTRKFTTVRDNVEFNDRRTDWTIDEFEFCDSNPNKEQNQGPAQTEQPKTVQKPYMQNTGTDEKPGQYVPF